ncbi:MAG: hypothetical protein AAFY38_09225 [Pseudomonadota bacterium]
MRLFAFLLLTATPALAWEFSPTPICTLTHTEGPAEITVTYDHGTQLYAVAITSPDGWPDASAFSIRFDGPRPNTISTARHQTEGNTLTVTDTGFGNVLDGLEFNRSTTAFTQTAAVTFSLDGAAEQVARFRDCTKAPVA